MNHKSTQQYLDKYTHTQKIIAFYLCLCMLFACLCWDAIKVDAAEYADIRDWVPITERPAYDLWGGQGASTVPNIEQWKEVGYNKTVEGSYFVWGKQITWESAPEAWEIFSQTNDLNAVADYLNDTYKYIAGYHQAQIWYCISVSWSLGSTELVNGYVRYIFEAVTDDHYKTGSAADMGYTGSENVYNGSHTLKLYLYLEAPPEGLEGVTDWMPRAAAEGNDAWEGPGKEGKDVTLLDAAAAEIAPQATRDFSAWLNNAANGYTQLIVKTADGWTEPYEVTWSYDNALSKTLNESFNVEEGYQYFAFAANPGANFFYGADGVYEKGPNTPLKFYLYFKAEAEPDPEERRGANGWRLVLKGSSAAVVTAYNDDSVYGLPNIVEGTSAEDYRRFAEKLLEMYDFQVSFDGNVTFTTYKLNGFSYQENGGYYSIEPYDSFFWSWGNALNPRVSVREGLLSLQNCANWGLAGYGATTWIGNDLVVNDGTNFEEEVDGKEEAFAEILKSRYVVLTVQRDGSANWEWTNSLIKSIEYNAEKSAYYNATGIRKTAVYKVEVYDTFYRTGESTPAEFYIVFTGLGDFGDLETITVKAKDPDGIRMNLFDYWINDDPSNENGNPWDRLDWDQQYNWEDFDRGVNYNHALKFFNMGYATENTQSADRRYLKDYLGWWNYSTENVAQNVTGIVQSTLFRRYPQLALGPNAFNPPEDNNPRIHTGIGDAKYMTESLAYLFDPTYKHEGKANHANVTGLFQRDEDGYYYYDSKLNYAQYDELYNSFLLYNTWGVAAHIDNDGKQASPNGQFFPFNNLETVFDNVSKEPDPVTGQRTLVQDTSKDSRAEVYNHFFGFSMEIDFQQPEGGLVGEQKNQMIFRFSGDDDVWIFVDGVLVLDLGGVHSGVYGEINFSTGEVRTGLMDPQTAKGAAMSGNPWVTTNLKAIFDGLGLGYGMENDMTDWEGNTFAYDTLHTIKVFYLERGHFDSNLAMYFNLQPRVPHKIYKVDEDGAPLAGATFAIYAAAPADEAGFDNTQTYHSAKEFVLVDNDGTPIDLADAEPLNAELVTDTEGYVTLGGVDFANRAEKGKRYYILVETAPAAGYRVLPEWIILEYEPDDDHPLQSVFRVLNPHETGTYASFSAILENTDDVLYYANSTVDPDTGKMTITRSEDEVIDDFHQESAMLFAVPMVYADLGDGATWYPVCGSNTNGYHIVDIYSYEEYFTHPDNTNGYTANDPEGLQYAYRWALRHNLLAAAIRQTANVEEPDWYFHYDTYADHIIDGRYTAELLNMPGDKSRYLLVDGEESINGADLRIVGLLVDAESVVAMIESNGGSVTLEQFKALTDEDKYLLLQDTLTYSGFEEIWNEIYFDEEPNWSEVREWLDSAYTENTDGTKRSRGVNLAYIDDFTRYYGSVFYIPNERRELRVLKEGPNGEPLEGAVFGLFETFEDAVNYTGEGDAVIATGVTGTNGILIFSRSEDTSQANAGSGWTRMNWDVYTDIDTDQDNIVWLRELSAPKGYKINESIVQVYVGERSIYANASAYRAAVDENGKTVPELIDDLTGASDEEILSGEWSDGVTVWAGVGKLFQTMEKYADPVLNSTLLDIDGRTYHFLPDGTYANPEDADWLATGELFRLHFWDRLVLGYTTSDYSTAHQREGDGTVGGEVFAVTENGYLKVMPTQTPDNVFYAQHAGKDEASVRNARRNALFYNDGTPLDLYNIFSPVCGVVIRDEREGNGNLRITKEVKGDAPKAITDSKEYTFTITGPAEAAGKTYEVEGAAETTVTFPAQAPYTVTVTVIGAGSAFLKGLESGEYTITEAVDNAEIGGYRLDVAYTPENGKVTVQNETTVSCTVTNTYTKDSTTPPDGPDCRLTITDGGHYGEEGCGEENEIFLYRVTGITDSGEIIELLVAVPGGGSTTVTLPAGHYTVTELNGWSWKYKNVQTRGREADWSISGDLLTGTTTLAPGDAKEIIYSHRRNDKHWEGGEGREDNRFTGA